MNVRGNIGFESTNSIPVYGQEYYIRLRDLKVLWCHALKIENFDLKLGNYVLVTLVLNLTLKEGLNEEVNILMYLYAKETLIIQRACRNYNFMQLVINLRIYVTWCREIL